MELDKNIRKNIISFFKFEFLKRPEVDAGEIDKLLTEIESHVFPADKPTIPRSKRTIRRKFKKLMELIGEKGEDWEGLV